MIASFILAMIIVPLAVAEIGELAPWLAEKILRWGARRLRDPALTARYTEEWLADFERVRGKLTKLGWAVGVAAFGVVKLRAAKPRMGWDAARIVVPFETDSLFGPGNSGFAERRLPAAATYPPALTPPAVVPEAPRMRSAPSHALGQLCGGGCDEDCRHSVDPEAFTSWSPPIGLPTPRRYETPPPGPFAGWRAATEDRARAFRYPSLDHDLFRTGERTSAPVIGKFSL